MASSTISLPVSIGEALDKLTILDIKRVKITDTRRDDVDKEFIALDTLLRSHCDQYAYYYKLLREINLAIWELQEQFHGVEVGPAQGAVLCKKILEENDRRFRVKSKLNHAASSDLKEQKGYSKRKAFVLGHLGLGDMFWMNGAVRYLATAFDEVVVVCKAKYAKNVQMMYSDDPTISLCVIESDHELYPRKRKEFAEKGFVEFACGVHKRGARITEFPLSFYDDFNLPRDIRSRYFHVPLYPEAIQLFDAINAVESRYIVVHQQSSTKTLPIWDAVHKKYPEILILDVNENHYSADDRFHALAELVVNKPLLHYTTLLEHAFEIYMLESSLYCMATHLDLSAVKHKYCYLSYDQSNERLGVFETPTMLL